jgi:UDP-glucose 4-epimerase
MRVLVTGVSHQLGGRLARRLEERPDVTAIFGIDIADPRVALERTEFVHADTRHSLLTKLVRGLDVDTVVHCAVLTEGDAANRVIHETNVIGTMNLLAACSGRDSPVRRLVVKSSIALYGCQPYAPSFVREDMAGRETPGEYLGQDLLEMEQLVQDFALRSRQAAVTVLRLGHRLGIGDPTALGRYFQLRRIPSFLGFDPRLQLLHEDDAVEALYRAAVADHAGVYNVAADGVLLLSQAANVARRPKLSVLFPYLRVLARSALRGAGVEMPAFLADFLTYGCVVDTTALERQFGWRPAHTTHDTLAEFVNAGREGVEAPVLGPQEYELSMYLQRRRRVGRPVRVLK